MTAAPARDLQAEARDAYRASVAAGAPLSARQLGEMFERSDRWGRQVIADTVAADRSNGRHSEAERQPEPAGAEEVAAEELLPDVVRVLGPDDPHTLAIRDNLAYRRRRQQGGGSRPYSA